MQRSLFRTLWIVALVVGMLAPTGAAATDIVFAGHRDHQEGSMYRVDPGTGETKRLTSLGEVGFCTFGCGYDLTWSHDRNKIAFTDRFRIWTIKANGSDRKAITGGSDWGDQEPSWSPGDNWLAMQREPDEQVEIWRARANGDRKKQLDRRFVPYDPMWSPAANEIAYSRPGSIHRINMWDGNHKRIFYRDLDGGEAGPRFLYNALWSPDGRWVSFVATHSRRDTGEGNLEIWKTRRDGDEQVRLTRTARSIDDDDPAWSPDGQMVAWVRSNDGAGRQIWIMQANGSDKRRLTVYGENFDPAWSPDSTRIAFASTRNGQAEIYVININGTGLTRLTSNDRTDVEPAWSTDGGSGS